MPKDERTDVVFLGVCMRDAGMAVTRLSEDSVGLFRSEDLHPEARGGKASHAQRLNWLLSEGVRPQSVLTRESLSLHAARNNRPISLIEMYGEEGEAEAMALRAFLAASALMGMAVPKDMLPLLTHQDPFVRALGISLLGIVGDRTD